MFISAARLLSCISPATRLILTIRGQTEANKKPRFIIFSLLLFESFPGHFWYIFRRLNERHFQLVSVCKAVLWILLRWHKKRVMTIISSKCDVYTNSMHVSRKVTWQSGSDEMNSKSPSEALPVLLFGQVRPRWKWVPVSKVHLLTHDVLLNGVDRAQLSDGSSLFYGRQDKEIEQQMGIFSRTPELFEKWWNLVSKENTDILNVNNRVLEPLIQNLGLFYISFYFFFVWKRKWS